MTVAAKRPHVMTPARQAHLDVMRKKAAAKRAAEGTEPQREGARKRHAKPTSPDVAEARFSGAPAPPAPAATPPAPAGAGSDTPPTPARAAQSLSGGRAPAETPRPGRPTPISDLRGLARRIGGKAKGS